MIEELKPCPFCGSDAFLEIKSYCYVRCTSCCVDGPVFDNLDEHSDGELEAAKLWNARAAITAYDPDKRLREALEAAKAHLGTDSAAWHIIDAALSHNGG